MSESQITRPSEVTSEIGLFDRFAEWASLAASRAPFFFACIMLVVLWLTEGLISSLNGKGFAYFVSDKYQLQINTTTTILTFLMVALLQNSQTRQNNATQHKLNAIAGFLARRAEAEGDGEAAKELTAAVGIELRESA